MRRNVVPLLEYALTGLGLIWLAYVLVSGRPAIGLLIAWDLAALGYIMLNWIALRRNIPDEESVEGDVRAPAWQATLFAVVASGSGLVGGMLMIVWRDDDAADPWLQPAAAATVLLSWVLLHMAFAQIYARSFYTEGGLDFPHCESPQATEFLYFSFTVGTSFAVSDVTVTSTPMRRRLIVHSVLSFFFNAAVVAIALDWIKG
ncbi:hypothetical protein TPAU25S_03724 [Tsukamurella paurometabola]|nr:Predicted membrane protein [Tsukamurella paurometabola]